jgi:hypothetical protein
MGIFSIFKSQASTCEEYLTYALKNYISHQYLKSGVVEATIKKIIPIDDGYRVPTDEELIEVEKIYDNLEQINAILNILYPCGINIIFPILGYEALNWRGPASHPFKLITLLCSKICDRFYPDSVELLNLLADQSPDILTDSWLRKNTKRSPGTLMQRYGINIIYIEKTIVSYSENYDNNETYWPGGSKNTKRWENEFSDLPNKFGFANEILRSILIKEAESAIDRYKSDKKRWIDKNKFGQMW